MADKTWIWIYSEGDADSGVGPLHRTAHAEREIESGPTSATALDRMLQRAAGALEHAATRGFPRRWFAVKGPNTLHTRGTNPDGDVVDVWIVRTELMP